MDAQDKGESKIRQRQESLARRVGEALDQLKPGEARDCPDAEIVAAYADQALTPAETARWEGHFATCARCRNVLRVLAASSDAPLAEKEVSHLGELVSATHAPVAIDSKAAGTARPSRAAWRARWLAPAICVAAVLVVWFVMRPPWRAMERRSSQVLVAQAPKEELPPSTPPPAVDQALKGQEQDQKAAAPEDSLAKALPPNSLANAPARDGAAPGAEANNISPSPSGAATNPSTEKKADSALPRREIQPPAPPPPPPAVPQQQAKSTSNLGAAGNLQAEANSDTATNQLAQNKQAGGAQASAAGGGSIVPGVSPSPASRARQQQAMAFRPAQASSFLLKAPASSTVWRVGKGGAIERSTDAGKTWVSQMSPSQQDWLAGTAFSDMVCWLAGRKGAIAETVDGQHWDLITPPAQAANAGGVQPDWIGITAFDALSATVTSADGRKFTTGDGGMTWQAQ